MAALHVLGRLFGNGGDDFVDRNKNSGVAITVAITVVTVTITVVFLGFLAQCLA